MLAYTINATGNPTTALRIVEVGLQARELGPVIGASAVKITRRHLLDRNLEPNQFGAAKTNFYQKAANAVQWQLVGDTVVISINSVGIAQRYFGGTIRPVAAKFLTIPARAEAHGKRASEFSPGELTLVFGRNGPIALARRASTALGFRKDRKTGLRRAYSKGEQGGDILFWLKREVTQQPDPTVLPEHGAIETAVRGDVDAYVNRLFARAGGAS